MTDSRVRLAAKCTAKGFWYLDCTVENEVDFFRKILNKDDIGDTEEQHIAEKLLGIIKKAEQVFRADGRKMVGDED